MKKSIEECNILFNRLSKKNADDEWNNTYVNQCRQCEYTWLLNFRLNDMKIIIKESFEIIGELKN